MRLRANKTYVNSIHYNNGPKITRLTPQCKVENYRWGSKGFYKGFMGGKVPVGGPDIDGKMVAFSFFVKNGYDNCNSCA